MLKCNNQDCEKKPLFSVIVPIYKVEKYLDECVHSIQAQTFRDIEIILVDDGSPDGCAEKCDAFAKEDFRIKAVHKENGGIVSARQEGINIANGDYIACVDGDDWIAPNYFEEFAKVIIQYQPDTVCCGYIEDYGEVRNAVHEANRTGFYTREHMEREIFPKLICNRKGESFSPNLWAKVFKREIYQQQQLVDALVIMGEDDACTKPTIYHSSTMYIIDKCLYYYRYNPTSITKNKRTFPWDGPLLRGKHMESQIDMDQFDFKQQLYRVMVRAIFTVAASQFNRKDTKKNIVDDIKSHLQEPYYQEAIIKCDFPINSKFVFMQLALRYRWAFFMKWFCKYKL